LQVNPNFFYKANDKIVLLANTLLAREDNSREQNPQLELRWISAKVAAEKSMATL
jgi:hypothetical protein